jgi:alkanesulfonate monooxygenase SsuD/methylene tetrahydromethanopterin reductase-like flavin-dependent oxidoreductase (luciferase family)
VTIIKQMWAEDTASFEGKYYRVGGAVCEPKPVQQPRPPIWIGGGGEQLTLRVVAEQADGCNFIGLSVDEYDRKLAVLARHCEATGRNPADVRKSWQGTTIIGEDRAEIERKLASAAAMGDVNPAEIEVHGIVGTPDECIARISEYVDLGVDRFMLSFPDSATDLGGLRLFADQVLPTFQ